MNYNVVNWLEIIQTLYFDFHELIIFSVDRSQNGLGTALLQNDLPVAYASKALNESQHSFPHIEKELLALVFGCEQFHQYIFGCAVLTIKLPINHL